MLNRILITGRLVADPELRKTQNDISVARFRIACNRDFRNKDGEYPTDFFSAVAWRSTAEFAATYYRKGSLMTLDGRLQSGSYEDKEGNKRQSVEIVVEHIYFGESKKEDGSSTRPKSADSGKAAPPPSFDPFGGGIDVDFDDDDDLPF